MEGSYSSYPPQGSSGYQPPNRSSSYQYQNQYHPPSQPAQSQPLQQIYQPQYAHQPYQPPPARHRNSYVGQFNSTPVAAAIAASGTLPDAVDAYQSPSTPTAPQPTNLNQFTQFQQSPYQPPAARLGAMQMIDPDYALEFFTTRHEEMMATRQQQARQQEQLQGQLLQQDPRYNAQLEAQMAKARAVRAAAHEEEARALAAEENDAPAEPVVPPVVRKPVPHVNIKTKFPVARIKRIMQADEDVGKVAQVTPVIVSKALELFMVSLVTKAAEEARTRNSKRITAAHLKQAVVKEDQFDFLADVMSKAPDMPEASASSGIAGPSAGNGNGVNSAALGGGGGAGGAGGGARGSVAKSESGMGNGDEEEVAAAPVKKRRGRKKKVSSDDDEL